ncbi:hypothetical protein V6N12_050239 [Hibiscus sabdariffa]|uniref:Uncharacterized protein n=1 Tax=Hibiscus sabdariffa TaxID=183260 RepID=A0ABR2GBW4_9ROSI
MVEVFDVGVVTPQNPRKYRWLDDDSPDRKGFASTSANAIEPDIVCKKVNPTIISLSLAAVWKLRRREPSTSILSRVVASSTITDCWTLMAWDHIIVDDLIFPACSSSSSESDTYSRTSSRNVNKKGPTSTST